MKYRVILNVSDEHPALDEEKTALGMDLAYLVRLAFHEWQGIDVASVEPLDHHGAAASEVDEKPSEDCPGEGLRARRTRLGLTVRALAQHSVIDRATIARAEDGTKKTRPATFGALHRALDEIEILRAGKIEAPPASSPPAPNLNEVEFQVSRKDGFMMTVRGPSSHTDTIGASVVRLMRDLHVD